MQIECLADSQMGLRSMQREPVRVGSVVGVAAVPANMDAAATKKPARTELRMLASGDDTVRSVAAPRAPVKPGAGSCYTGSAS